MKVTHINDIDGFFKAVENCDGKVELVVSDELRLNLKSKLSQYFSLAEIFSGGVEIPELEIVCEKPEDSMKIIKFMVG